MVPGGPISRGSWILDLHGSSVFRFPDVVKTHGRPYKHHIHPNMVYIPNIYGIASKHAIHPNTVYIPI